MLFSKVLQTLAVTGLACARTVPSHKSTNLATRQDAGDLDALEHAANSRLPDISLPVTINDATTTLLQLMTIWFESEISAYHETIALISNNSNGYTDLGRWNKSEVLDILNTNLAVLPSHSLYFNLCSKAKNGRNPLFNSTTLSPSSLITPSPSFQDPARIRRPSQVSH